MVDVADLAHDGDLRDSGAVNLEIGTGVGFFGVKELLYCDRP